MNPAGQGHVHLEYIDDQVVGLQSVCLRRVLVHGEPRLVAEMGNSFTHPDFRGRGVFARCIKGATDHCRSTGIDIMYATPNDQSLPAVDGKRGHVVAANARFDHLLKILTDDEFVRRLREMAPFLPPRPDARLLSLTRRAAFLQWPDVSADQGLETQVIHRVPEGIDGLWGRDRSGMAFFTVRDAAYLNWRYFSHPYSYLCLGSFQGLQLVGFCALHTRRDDSSVRSTVVDLLALDDSEDVLMPLLRTAERVAAGLGAVSLTACCSYGSPYRRMLTRRGFRRRRHGIPLVVATMTPAGRALAATRDPWHIMAGDTDNV
jgi:GNAT superfamily N-acetyltransferase